MIYFANFMLSFFVFLFGICIGSFLNVIIYRVPKKISFWKGRSYCPSCNNTLQPIDLIPVLSFVILHGKCRKCKTKISGRYLLVEIITGLIALFIFWSYYFTIISLIFFIISAILITIAFIDFDTMIIPNKLVIILGALSIISIFFIKQPDLISRVIGFFIISIPMLLISFLVKDAFGGGDIKLIAVCGFFLGWKGILLSMFIALLLGGTQGIILLIKDKNNSKNHISFGQYICVGVFVSMLYGNFIINKYLELFNLT